MKMTDKDLTIAFISFFMEKKASIDNLMELFNIPEDEARGILNILIERKAIYNYDFSKREMECISKDDFDNLIKTTGKSESELIKKYCVFNPKMTIDGTLREIKETPLSEKLKQQALIIAVDIGFVNTPILQRILKIGFHKTIKVLEWMEKHNYIDGSMTKQNGLIDRELLRKLYPKISISSVPLNLFRAYESKERYDFFLEIMKENKSVKKRFYDNMKAVKLEDILDLTEEDFNIIPSGWLYYWGKITGCNDFDKIEKLIEKRKEAGIDI